MARRGPLFWSRLFAIFSHIPFDGPYRKIIKGFNSGPLGGPTNQAAQHTLLAPPTSLLNPFADGYAFPCPLFHTLDWTLPVQSTSRRFTTCTLTSEPGQGCTGTTSSPLSGFLFYPRSPAPRRSHLTAPQYNYLWFEHERDKCWQGIRLLDHFFFFLFSPTSLHFLPANCALSMTSPIYTKH